VIEIEYRTKDGSMIALPHTSYYRCCKNVTTGCTEDNTLKTSRDLSTKPCDIPNGLMRRTQHHLACRGAAITHRSMRTKLGGDR
jgi:hypothetical protein